MKLIDLRLLQDCAQVVANSRHQIKSSRTIHILFILCGEGRILCASYLYSKCCSYTRDYFFFGRNGARFVPAISVYYRKARGGGHCAYTYYAILKASSYHIRSSWSWSRQKRRRSRFVRFAQHFQARTAEQTEDFECWTGALHCRCCFLHCIRPRCPTPLSACNDWSIRGLDWLLSKRQGRNLR